MKIFRYISRGIIMIILLWIAELLVRIFICDSFVVRGISMEPTLHDGNRVYVNKLKMGARIYTAFDFSSPEMKSFRMPGLRKISLGDIVVINDPYYRTRDSITFAINHVYIKRCYGCPGDTVRIQDGYYIHPLTGEHLGTIHFQNVLSTFGDSLLRSKGIYVNAWNVNKLQNWTILDFGPLYVPKKGDVVHLTPENFRSYKKQIHYETRLWLEEKDGKIMLDKKPISEYEFLSDWYFLGGDNVLNSRDSRYIGFMPADFIIGIVSNIE